MKIKRALALGAAWLTLSILNLLPTTCFAQGTAFTYQGWLNDAGAPAHGNYDLRFMLYDAEAGGSQQGPTVATNAVAVTNGLFTVTLDFGDQFPGGDRWLGIGVRTNGAASFTALAPRQALTSAPYAITASNLTGALPAAQLSGAIPAANLSGTYGNAITFNNAGNSYAGNGGGLTGVNAATLNGLSAGNFWQTAGNAGTTAGADFVGTADNQPLELHVNGARALRLEPAVDNGNIAGAMNVIAGAGVNFVAPSAHGGTIAGGGAPYYFGNGMSNWIASDFGTIGGGVNNDIQTLDYESTIGGGNANTIQSNAYRSTISGGWNNTIGTNSYQSVIAGGINNAIRINANNSVIGGGQGNQISWSLQNSANDSTISGGFQNFAGDPDSTIGGGFENSISSYGSGSVIGGGFSNKVTYTTFLDENFGGSASTIAGGSFNQSSCDYGTIGGGYGNAVENLVAGAAPTVSGGHGNTAYAGGAVPGGESNYAAFDSFAAGDNAQASSAHSFVWGDGSATATDNGANTFNVLSSRGMVLTVSGSSGLNPAALYVNSTSANGVGLYVTESSSDAAFVVNNAGTADLIKGFNGGGSPVFEVVHDGTVYSKGIALTSDRNAKENFAALDAQSILARVISLPVTEWNYKTDAADARHIGPMAQDFHATFGLNGQDDKHISVIDESGVALAAIQGLNQKLNEKDVEMTKQAAEIQSLKLQLDKLEQLINNRNGGAK